MCVTRGITSERDDRFVFSHGRKSQPLQRIMNCYTKIMRRCSRMQLDLESDNTEGARSVLGRRRKKEIMSGL